MNDKTIPTVRERAPAIALALGAVAVLPVRETDHPNYYDDGHATLTLPGAVLYLSYDSYRKRLNVGVEWPSYKDSRGNRQMVRPDSFLTWEERKQVSTTSITCDIARAPEAIAKDITRRLLPVVVPFYARALEYIREQEASRDKRMAVAKRIAAAFNYRLPSDGRDEMYGAGNLPTLEVGYDGNVRIKHLDVSEETAFKVLALLAKAGA